MATQRSLLYEYQGQQISLHFPIEADALDSYIYLNWYKEISVSATSDNLGITWLRVDATVKCEDDLLS